MKAYTDLGQSKKLAEILPLESADMYWKNAVSDKYIQCFTPFVRTDTNMDYDVPCWSLAALLGVLPVSCDDGQHCLSLINPNPDEKTEWLCAYEDCKGDLILECYADNQIDACVKMILKLHELKML